MQTRTLNAHCVAGSLNFLAMLSTPVVHSHSRHFAFHSFARQPTRPSWQRRDLSVVTCAVGTEMPFKDRQKRSPGGQRGQQPLDRAQALFKLLREIGAAAAASGPLGINRHASSREM